MQKIHGVDDLPYKPFSTRRYLIQSILFLTFGSLLWIVLSDRILLFLVTSPQEITAWQTTKGIVYVLAINIFHAVSLLTLRTITNQRTEDLAERNKQLNFVNETSAHLNTIYKLEALHTEILPLVIQRFKPVVLTVYLDPHQVNPTVKVLGNLSDAQRKQWREYSDTMARKLKWTMKSQVDGPTALDFTSSVLAAPIVHENKIRRILLLASETDKPFNISDLLTLNALTAQVGGTIGRIDFFQQLQNQIASLEELVAERTRHLETANRQMREIDRVKSAIITEINHELRTPISNIILYTDLLKRGSKDRHPHYIEALERQADQLKSHLDQTFNLERLELISEKARYQEEKVNINEIVANVVRQFSAAAADKGLDLTLDAYPDGLETLGNANQILQAMFSILDNALTYTNEGYIRVRTQLDKEREEIQVIITDSGIGIPENEISYVFNSLFRGSLVAGANIPGTGLGLTIVKEIMLLHMGRVEIKSEVGVGTTVELCFPLQRETIADY